MRCNKDPNSRETQPGINDFFCFVFCSQPRCFHSFCPADGLLRVAQVHSRLRRHCNVLSDTIPHRALRVDPRTPIDRDGGGAQVAGSRTGRACFGRVPTAVGLKVLPTPKQDFFSFSTELGFCFYCFVLFCFVLFCFAGFIFAFCNLVYTLEKEMGAIHTWHNRLAFSFWCRAPLGARRQTLRHMCWGWVSWQLDPSISPLDGYLQGHDTGRSRSRGGRM